MLQIDFGPKFDFRSPKVSVDCEQEHDLRNHDFKTEFSKSLVFLVVFGVKIIEIPLKFSSNLSGGGVKRRGFWAQSAKTGSQKHQETLYTS